jgi:hypothetical protein
MNRINFDSIDGFVSSIIPMYETKDISIVAKYEEAQEILRLLIIETDQPLQFLELEPDDYGDYKDEFCIEYYPEYGISCSKAKMDDRYLNIENDYTFIIDNCNSRVLKSVHSDVQFEVGFGERRTLGR